MICTKQRAGLYGGRTLEGISRRVARVRCAGGSCGSAAHARAAVCVTFHVHAACESLFAAVGAMGRVGRALVWSIPMSTREAHLKMRMKK